MDFLIKMLNCWKRIMTFGIKSKIILLKNLIASPFTIISFWKIKVRSYSYKTTDFHVIKIPEADSNDIC